MARPDNEGSTPRHGLPEEFCWPQPQWFRIDRLRARPIRFAVRVVIGGMIGLLFGRVLGSLQGLFLQWTYDGLVQATSGVEVSLGKALQVVAMALGAVFSPFLRGSPLAESYSAVRSSGTGTDALLFLAQFHGSLNGLYQGLKPALGERLQSVVEPAILSWGLLWHWLTWPARALVFKRPRPDELKTLLRDAARSDVARRLSTLSRRGLLPRAMEEPEREDRILASWPGKIAADKRQELWWTKPGFRSEVYRWIETAHETRALPLLVHGLDDPDESARRGAITALASLGTPDAIPYLVMLLDDSREISALAVEGLKQCAERLEP